MVPIFNKTLISLFLLSLVGSLDAKSGNIAADNIPAGNKTSSHVFMLTQKITSELHLIRANQGLDGTSRDPGVQVNKMALHCYSKANVLYRKVSKLAVLNGLPMVEVGPIPHKVITSSEVFNLVSEILIKVREIKAKFLINDQINNIDFVPGKSPADVYESIWRASYLMDGLVEEDSPNDVFRNVLLMGKYLDVINNHLDQLELANVITKSKTKRVPEDVLIEYFVTMYGIARLEYKLGMRPFYVPPLPGGKITPANVYDTTCMLLAEFVRIKVFLEIPDKIENVTEQNGKTPTNVFELITLFQKNVVKITQN